MIALGGTALVSLGKSLPRHGPGGSKTAIFTFSMVSTTPILAGDTVALEGVQLVGPFVLSVAEEALQLVAHNIFVELLVIDDVGVAVCVGSNLVCSGVTEMVRKML